MKTYDDIQSVSEALIRTEADVERIGSRDLAREARDYLAAGHTDAVFLTAGAHNEEGVAVLYLPASGRAGVAWGAGADWTDADDAQDALERYFGVDGKEMVP